MKLNKNYLRLEESYLFSTVAHKVSAFAAEHPDRKILRMGIGDVTLPLAPRGHFRHARRRHGDGRQEHLPRLRPPSRATISCARASALTMAAAALSLDADEIFISDGAKSDLGNILDIFDTDNTVLVPDPVYPVYVDTNVMAGQKDLVFGRQRIQRFPAHAR